MALPKILLGDGKIVLLSGFQNAANSITAPADIVDSEEALEKVDRKLDPCLWRGGGG